MMVIGKRLIWILTIAAFMVMTSGCSKTYLRLVEDELARDGSGLYQEKGQGIEGFLLHDGTETEYKGRVRLASQDSLKFWSEGYSEETYYRGIKKTVEVPGPVFPLASVKALSIRGTKTGATILLVVGMLGGIIAISVLTSSSSGSVSVDFSGR